jgi:flap endonuclease-1
MPVKEYHLDKVLEGLGMSMDQFIDLCILLGCDYCEKIRGLGPKCAVKFVQDYKSIEKILEIVDKKKHSVPENWLFREARALFKSPEVIPSAQIKLRWSKPDEDGLVKFLCDEKGFNEERIRRGTAKLTNALEMEPSK